MAFLSMDDPDFWSRSPKELEHLVRGTFAASASYFLLGDRADNPPTVIALRLEPGWVVARHAHDCHRFEIVVQGTLDVGERILKPGDVMISEPGVAYGPHIAGPEGCTTFEVFANHRASYVTLLDEQEGLVECDISTPEGARKMQDLLQGTARSG